MTQRLPAWVYLPAMTLLVMVGFFVPPAASDRVPAAVPVQDAGGFEAVSEGSEGQPTEARWFTAGASFATLVPPERARLRATLRVLGSNQEPRPGGATSLSAAPTRTPLQGALPFLRHAWRAGRFAAPSTAPPAPSV